LYENIDQTLLNKLHETMQGPTIFWN